MSKDEPAYELSFISTPDLIRELLGRYDHAIFAAKKCVRRKGPEKREQVVSVWRGDKHMIGGLAMDAIHLCMKQLNETVVEDPPEEF